MNLLFATHNQHKTEEIRSILSASGLDVKLMSLHDLYDDEDIIESGVTLDENALIKARAGYVRHGFPTFADDTGLEVDALDGAPGVYSARYAGESACSEDNVRKLLKEMEGVKLRNARFRTVIALILEEKEYLFQGIVEGTIIQEERGKGGFGYDPLFVPNGSHLTFAEMSEEEKNRISHRGKAVAQLVAFLKERFSDQ